MFSLKVCFYFCFIKFRKYIFYRFRLHQLRELKTFHSVMKEKSTLQWSVILSNGFNAFQPCPSFTFRFVFCVPKWLHLFSFRKSHIGFDNLHFINYLAMGFDRYIKTKSPTSSLKLPGMCQSTKSN